MTKVFIDKSLLEQAINTLGYYASVCGEDDQDTPAKQAQTALRAAQAEPAVGPVAKAMTAHRAAYFMERFKKEEKLLGPNEQAAVDFVIDMLTATHTAPPPPAEPAADAAPAAVTGPIEAVAYLDIGTGGYLDLGTDLADEALSRLPKGRHALVIAGTYGIDGYIAAPTTQPEPQQELRCNPHPKAPHGFDRNSSHSAHRYVCECESWEPYDAGFNAGFQAGMKAEQALYESAEDTQEMEKRNDQA